MSARPFVHLNCHSHYSLLKAAGQIRGLVARAKELGMNALALTDAGNLYGAIQFYDECKSAGIKPILGYKANIAPGGLKTSSSGGIVPTYRLTILAKNGNGFQNLIKLASFASVHGLDGDMPRLDRATLEKYHEDLLFFSGEAESEIGTLIERGRFEEAVSTVEWYTHLVGDRFFLEIQNQSLDRQGEQLRNIVALADHVGVPVVATNNVRYLKTEDASAHEVLLCIQSGKKLSDPHRPRLGSSEFYLKSPDEMYAAFPEFPDAVARTQEIADRIDIKLDFTRHFPVFTPPEGKTVQDYLADLCEKGFRWRYGDEVPAAARERLAIELGVINKLGFASYFLIVWDFVNFALERGIPCTARGSGCGALVAYLLGFSNVDPLKYDLLFERFLDPSRAEAPDIDIDFCQKRREEVVEYTREKYGQTNVAQIITYGTMAARAVVRDVGRALEVELKRVDQIAKAIPGLPKMTLKKALEQSPELSKEYESDPLVQKLVDIGKGLEGLARNAGTHAAGVVVADRDLTEYVPLQLSNGATITQWEMTVLEKVGMLKFDFLGLRNLTLLTDAVALVEKVYQTKIELLKLPLDDPKTYALLQRGETKGIFQLESEGIRNLLVRMKPDRFEDIIATCALYRPGPLGGGMVDTYINVKHGREEASYAHVIMKPILEETYGVMVYQEQVMRILNRLGGIELANAYKCIKAISKKKIDVIAKYKTEFSEGSQKHGLTAEQADEIFALIEHFAGYGFNKSHSTAYALIAYQTAYLKAHYPDAFMAALLSSELDNTDKLVDHIDDCKRMGIDVKPPDVNEGDVSFTVVDGVVRFGLAAIKGVGERAIDAIVSDRQKNGPFRNIFDLCERVDTRVVTKGCLESLVKGGAFDSFGGKRRQLFDVLPTALRAGGSARDARSSGQGLLFGGPEEAQTVEDVSHALPNVPEWSDKEKLAYEKALLGIYLSSHPLSEHQKLLRVFRTHELNQLAGLQHGTEVTIAGMISDLRLMIQQRGRNANQRYARFMMEDATGRMSCVMFADVYAEFGERLNNDVICFLRCEVDTSREEVGLIANEFISLETAPQRLSGSLVIRIDGPKLGAGCIYSIKSILSTRPGQSPVFLNIRTANGLGVRMRAADEILVACDQELVKQIESIVGEGNVSIRPNPMAPRTNGPPKNGRRQFSKARNN
ncbi:DNA polymerase III subunit alpha [bacterium]|jgi:DNA polymerase-3 subunit alpha|nr:DNA polymerase III subunit alpha [bacterium]